MSYHIFTNGKTRPILLAVLYTAVGVLLVLVVYVILLIRGTQTDRGPLYPAILEASEEGARAAEAAERGTDRIEDCTTPGRECYEDSQRRTARLIDDINRAAVYAAACADKPGVQGSDEIYSCVIRKFAQDARQQ